jgi:hypothetical protein
MATRKKKPARGNGRRWGNPLRTRDWRLYCRVWQGSVHGLRKADWRPFERAGCALSRCQVFGLAAECFIASGKRGIFEKIGALFKCVEPLSGAKE